jgi:hypothetical protein
MSSALGLALLGGASALLLLFLRAAVSAAARWQERAERDEAQILAARNANDIENKITSDASYRQRVRDAFKADP